MVCASHPGPKGIIPALPGTVLCLCCMTGTAQPDSRLELKGSRVSVPREDLNLEEGEK